MAKTVGIGYTLNVISKVFFVFGKEATLKIGANKIRYKPFQMPQIFFNLFSTVIRLGVSHTLKQELSRHRN